MKLIEIKAIIQVFIGDKMSLTQALHQCVFDSASAIMYKAYKDLLITTVNLEDLQFFRNNEKFLNSLFMKDQCSKFKIQSKDDQKLLLEDSIAKEILQINHFCQTKFLRQAGTERQQMVDLDEKMQEQLKPLLQSQFFDAVKPTISNPDYVIIFGAAQAGCQARIKQFLQDIKDGLINPKKIALLAGERPGWALQEPILYEMLAKIMQIPVEKVRSHIFEIADKHFPPRSPDIRNNYDDPKFVSGLTTKPLEAFRTEVRQYYEQAGLTKWPTETDIIIAVFNKLLKDEFPESQEFLKDKIEVVNALMKEGRRPTTEDTIKAFKEMVGNNDITVVAYSNQPHIPYQDATLEPHFNNRQVVGSSIEKPCYSETLDSLARFLFTIMPQMLQQRLQQLKIAHEEKSSHSFLGKLENERLMTTTSPHLL